MDETEYAKNMGILLKNLPPKHTREYTQGLTLDENTFLQKLVAEDILTAKIKMQHDDGKTRTHTGVRVEAENYLKALVFLDYYSTVLDESAKVCENLITLAIKLREMRQKDACSNLILDLNLKTVVLETGLAAQTRSSESPESSQPENIAKRYNKNNAFIGRDPVRTIDPYYHALGLRIVEMISPDLREHLNNTTSRSGLEALMFTDCVLGALENQETVRLIKKDFSKNKLEASMTAFYAIRDEASLERLKKEIIGGYK